MNEGEIATRLGLSGITPRGRDHHGRARYAPGRDDRRRAFTPPMSRPPTASTLIRERQERGPAGHLRHRPALFRAERDRGRRLPHLRQAVAAAAHREDRRARDRRPRRRHDRRHRQRPPPAGPGRKRVPFASAASRRRRAGDAAASSLWSFTTTAIGLLDCSSCCA